MNQVDALRVEVDQLLKQEAENPNFRLEKRMEVCPTCGAFLIVGDAQKRIDSHFEGRQHTGWARVRQTCLEFRAKFGAAGDDRRAPAPRSARSPPPPAYRSREQGEIPEREDYRRQDGGRNSYRGHDQYRRDDHSRSSFDRRDSRARSPPPPRYR